VADADDQIAFGAMFMLMQAGRWLLPFAFGAYPILLHLFISKSETDILTLLGVFSPLLLLSVWMLFRSISVKVWPLAGALLLSAGYYLSLGGNERVGLLAMNGAFHALLNLSALLLFGRTLMSGGEALITQIARHISGELPEEIVRYTRHVTIAWCWFFVMQVVVSVVIYLFSNVVIWSFFINVLDLPLVLLMFAGEYGYRRLRYPDHPRISVAKVIEIYQHVTVTPATKPEAVR
jgi:uncharacterized membrane protein